MRFQMKTSTATPRWGLIGASDIAATRMVPAMRRLGHDVNAVCGSSAPRTTAWAAAHGVPHATTSVEALLARDDIDAVYISTTNQLHLPHTLAAAAAGKHVLCEKPLALSLADASSMVAACETAGVVLGVNHHLPGAATHRRWRTARMMRRAGYPLVFTERMGIETNSHQCGTAVMGANPAHSVLDPDCRAHDVTNLWAVDSSCFPSSAALNPALTIAANALRVAAKGGITA
jgi:1,5-anhydro-D-fructose reductase (1,5-anhydro-D-mannitol-forming)